MISQRFFHVLAVAVLVLAPGVAHAQSAEQIASFDVRARLASDRMLTVTEVITYDFGSNEKHGIYREIPVRYARNGGTYRYRLNVAGVTRDGEDEPYTTSESGGLLTLKIGDADRTITGSHVYAITYTTNRAINFFDGEGELYWNVTGNGWQVPIGQASFVLTGPDGFDAAPARVVCYTGVYGSTEQTCTNEGAGTQLTIAATRPLAPAEGLTFAVRFPKGLIVEPSVSDVFWQFIRDNAILLLPVLTLILMLWRWWTKGRDPEGRGTVIPQYDPPRGMNPAEMVSLKDQDVPQRAVTATILDLARRGYLKIDFGEEKGWLSTSQTYTFIKQKEPDATLTESEREIYDGVFASGDTVTLAGLKHKFYKSIKPFKDGILDSLVSRKFFQANPVKVRGAYVGGAIGAIVLTFWLFAAFLQPVTIGAIIASAVIVLVVGIFMPAKTKAGAEALEEVLGFKWFLSVTEKDRLAFHNAPERKPEQFHAFLPAAVAFGVEDKWAEQFKGLNVPPPDYATGAAVAYWNAVSFAHVLGAMNAAAASSAYASPSSAGSGGSGFSGGGSGGGGGGGGGGSW